MFGYHVTNLKFFISKNDFLKQRCDKCVLNKNLKNTNHIHMEDDKHN